MKFSCCVILLIVCGSFIGALPVDDIPPNETSPVIETSLTDSSGIPNVPENENEEIVTVEDDQVPGVSTVLYESTTDSAVTEMTTAFQTDSTTEFTGEDQTTVSSDPTSASSTGMKSGSIIGLIFTFIIVAILAVLVVYSVYMKTKNTVTGSDTPTDPKYTSLYLHDY